MNIAPEVHRFFMPTDVRCGRGVLAALEESSRFAKRPAILCGKQAARKHGHLDAVLTYLPNALILEGVPENPTFSDAESYVAPCRDEQVDLLIALGGGSVMDVAKALALCIPNEGRCRDFVDQLPPNMPLPVIAIPTTAGTGSEVTPYAVLVDEIENKKVTLRSPDLFPRMALLDPALTVSMPPEVTCATALDALSQAMEGMVSRKATPTGNLLALECCRAVRKYLPQALKRPDDLVAREGLLYAAMLSGMVIAQSGTTLVHGMGYYYTLQCGVAHGVANALLLPPLFWWNAHLVPEKTDLLAQALGCRAGGVVAEAPRRVAKVLYQFYDEIGFKPGAGDHGVPENALAAMATDIIGEPYRFKNQLGQFSLEQVSALFQASWTGNLGDLDDISGPRSE